MSGKAQKLGPRVTVSVKRGDYDALNAIADRDDVSVSWVVRKAIQDFLSRHRQVTYRKPEGKTLRAIDRA
ncbi:ribbon-helix-helix protein, CopG family [Phreatobacter sp.]|uniref:ribbon-helix-helix protein, CopG family n=1 Tax=Phreatobacter sp. TaxID=1966341 RepID=UPI00345A16BD